MSKPQTRGIVPQIIRNDQRLYEGDLIYYFGIVFNQAKNLRHPYHNFRHLFHVTVQVYLACIFYKDRHREALSKRDMRNLLIAGMFHDFNHTGRAGSDLVNIEEALRALRAYILPEDQEHLEEISELIRATEFPYKTASEGLPLGAQILRDADLSQVFSVAWIQQVVYGLASEWNKEPIDVLRMQTDFLGKLVFTTEWAKHAFPQSDIDAKIQESQELLDLLDEASAATVPSCKV